MFQLGLRLIVVVADPLHARLEGSFDRTLRLFGLVLQGLHFGFGLALDLLGPLPGLIQLGFELGIELVNPGLELGLAFAMGVSELGLQLIDVRAELGHIAGPFVVLDVLSGFAKHGSAQGIHPGIHRSDPLLADVGDHCALAE